MRVTGSGAAEAVGEGAAGAIAAAPPPRGGGRRDELLAAAEALIAERGLAALTVDDVTARAGVAKGTFYLSFATKGDMLAALRERYVATMHEQHLRALAELPDEDHAGRLDRWVAEAIGGHLAHARLHDALFHHDLPSLAVKTGVAPANPQLALLGDVLRAGAAAGAFSVEDPATTAALLYGAMHAAVDLLLGGGGGDGTAPEPAAVARVVAATQRVARGAAGAARTGTGARR